ncbi:MAG: CapA family protein [Spirochaetes bacterium]|nr:CapA family protein [Spirochaetota bacterium]
MKSRLIIILIIIRLIILKGLLYGEDTLRLTFAGDIMAHVINLIVPDYTVIYKNIEDVLSDDDLSFANLEFTIDESKRVSGYPRFNVHRDYIKAAVDSGFQVFSVANNHIYDYGIDGVFQTVRSIEFLKRLYDGKVYFSGIRGNLQRGFAPEVINIKGHRIYFIAVSQFLNRLEKSPYVFLADYRNKEAEEEFLKYIRKIRKNADLLILSYHGGKEYYLKPEREKISFFHRLIESGVDIVYSHHPHVLQPYEIVKHNDLRKLILYSTGNLISGMIKSLKPGNSGAIVNYTGDSVLFTVTVAFTNSGPDIKNIKIVPVAQYKNPEGYVVIDKMKNLTGVKDKKNRALTGDEYYKKRLKIINRVLTEQVHE